MKIISSLKIKLKEHIGDIGIILGSYIFVKNIFSFYSRTTQGSKVFMNDSHSDSPIYGAVYYYGDEQPFFIALGFTLLVAGLLYNKRQKS